jgi:hypothetical protein
LLNAWNLEAPRLMVSVTGAAVATWSADQVQKLEELVCNGVYTAAIATRAWVISGGTDAGCMQLLGRSAARNDLRGEAPIIGIMTKGKVKGHKALDRKGKDIEPLEVKNAFFEQQDDVTLDLMIERLEKTKFKDLELVKTAINFIRGRENISSVGQLLRLQEKKKASLWTDLNLSEDQIKILENAVPNYNRLNNDSRPEPNQSHFMFVNGWSLSLSLALFR